MGPFEKSEGEEKNQIVKSPFEKDSQKKFCRYGPFPEGQKDYGYFCPFVLFKRTIHPFQKGLSPLSSIR